jgi:hypothetical protein
VALVSMARSRREAVQIARQWAEDHMEAEADPDSESSLAAVSVYTEQWIEDAQGGRWEVLRRADGGYYRGFRPKDRRPRPDRRRRDQLGGW